MKLSRRHLIINGSAAGVGAALTGLLMLSGPAAAREKIFEANTRRAYPRLDARLKERARAI